MLFGANVLHSCEDFESEARWNAYCYTKHLDSEDADLVDAVAADALLFDMYGLGDLYELLSEKQADLADLLEAAYECRHEEMTDTETLRLPTPTATQSSITLSTSAALEYIADQLDCATAVSGPQTKQNAFELNLKCQKILWFASTVCAALYHRRLLDHPAEAWKNGPVYNVAWERFKELYEDHKVQRNPDVAAQIKRTDAVLCDVLDAVLSHLRTHAASDLAFMSHQEPLWMAASVGDHVEISDDDMQRFFSSRTHWNDVITAVSRNLAVRDMIAPSCPG